jgi:hypothetical protein
MAGIRIDGGDHPVGGDLARDPEAAVACLLQVLGHHHGQQPGGLGHRRRQRAALQDPQHRVGIRARASTSAGLLELPQQLRGRPAHTERVQDRPVVCGQAGRGRGGIQDLLAGCEGLREGVHGKLGQVPQHDLLEVEPRVPATPDGADQGVARVEEHPTKAHLGHPREAAHARSSGKSPGKRPERWRLGSVLAGGRDRDRTCDFCRVKGARPPGAATRHPRVAPHRSRSTTLPSRDRVVLRVASRGMVSGRLLVRRFRASPCTPQPSWLRGAAARLLEADGSASRPRHQRFGLGPIGRRPAGSLPVCA